MSINYVQHAYERDCRELIEACRPLAEKWCHYWDGRPLTDSDASNWLIVQFGDPRFGQKRITKANIDERMQRKVIALKWQLETFSDDELMRRRLAAAGSFRGTG